MKVYSSVLLFMIMPICMFAQEWPFDRNEHYVFQMAIIGSDDVTDEVLSYDSFIKFYPVGSGIDTFFMANIRPKSHSQSYGLITKLRHMVEYDNDKKMDIIEFNWNYNNTYDLKSGNANVRLVKIHYLEYVEFLITITLENKEELFYKGIVQRQIID